MASTDTSCRVVKLGGSLLRWPEWPRAMQNWLAANRSTTTVIVAGGGAEADRVRAEQSAVGMSDRQAHGLAVAAMSHNAIEVSRQLRVPRVIAFTEIGLCGIHVLDVASLLGGADGLPEDWSFTSDSISAWVANAWQRELSNSVQLVLLKSCLPGDLNHVDRWVVEGFVDSQFNRFARGLDVTAVNLREH